MGIITQNPSLETDCALETCRLLFAEAFSFLFVRHSKFFASTGAATGKYGTALFSRHTGTEAVGFSAFALFWLIGSFR